MSLQVAAHQTEGYTVQTELYAGPLDLLLDLIERAELDITRLALAQVTDQYLAYMHAMTNRTPAEVSAFLVIAARLVQIKSAALLPRPSVSENNSNEPDPGEALAQQLLIYRRFKQLAGWIEERQEAGLRTYLRVAAPVVKLDVRLDLSGLTLQDLMQAGWDVMGDKSSLESLDKVVNMPRVTIRDRIGVIIDVLRRQDSILFKELLTTRTRLEIVVTFLAMLELIKRHVLSVEQDGLFNDIQLRALGEMAPMEDFEVEFSGD